MTTQLNLTAAKVRRLLLITALVICPFFAVQTGQAQFTATATLTSGMANSITITNNQQFTLSLMVTTNFVSSGYTVFYQMTSGGAFFQLVSRMNTSPINATTGLPVFNDPTTSDAAAFGGNAGRFQFGAGMNSNQFDLGYTGDQTNNQPAGSFSLQNITINTLNAPVGTYTIRLDSRSIMTERGTFADVPMSATFTVNVIPEPTTVGLAILGGALLLVATRRKLRARA